MRAALPSYVGKHDVLCCRVGALERSGLRSRARRTLERGGVYSRGSGPSIGAEPVRGERTPSNGTEPARGRHVSSSGAKPDRGDLREGCLGGPLTSFAAWAAPCMVRHLHG
jgi:hypothetical protein